jgi:tRNA(fMet)-specific endonuclease VapC
MYLIDSDILIYSLKGNEIVKNNFKDRLNVPKSISVISYGELYFGAKKSKYIEKNLAAVRQISESFPIIEVKKSIMETFGDLKAKLQSNGLNIPDLDLIIASTALTMNNILVTNNEKHYNKIPGLMLENWTIK